MHVLHGADLVVSRAHQDRQLAVYGEIERHGKNSTTGKRRGAINRNRSAIFARKVVVRRNAYLPIFDKTFVTPPNLNDWPRTCGHARLKAARTHLRFYRIDASDHNFRSQLVHNIQLFVTPSWSPSLLSSVRCPQSQQSGLLFCNVGA